MGLPFADPLKRTIEYRIHESTLDPERVSHWIRVCLGLVENADTVPRVEFEAFLREHIGDPPDEFDLVVVLLTLGLGEEAVYYALRELRKGIAAGP